VHRERVQPRNLRCRRSQNDCPVPRKSPKNLTFRPAATYDYPADRKDFFGEPPRTRAN
jgi:hypothetical protein